MRKKSFQKSYNIGKEEKKKRRKAEPVLIFKVRKQENGKFDVDVHNMSNLDTKTHELLFTNKHVIGLYVSKYALLGDSDALAVVNWMTNTLYPDALNLDTMKDVVKRDADLKILQSERYLDIFRMVDNSICGIEVDCEKPYSESIIIKRDEAGKYFKRELQMDSIGVREFFALSVQIFSVVYENRVVFIDDMDRVLDPILSDRVVSFINGAEHKGQCIFSTHNVLHLNLKSYMKEQIYFITKSRENLTSEMYSLADFPEVHYETSKIYEFYMKGILGATAFE